MTSKESLRNSSGIFFPGFTSLQLCDRINNLLSSLRQTPETFTGKILFMSMFNDISCDKYDNRNECLKSADFVKTFARRFGIGQWSFIGPGSEKKWYPPENSPQGAWDHVAEEMSLKFAESGHPIFRSTTPLSRRKLKSKGKGNCPYTSVLTKIQLIQFIALFSLPISSVSTGQWQLYVKNTMTSQIAWGNPSYWRVSQLFLEKSKLKHLLVKNLKTPSSFCRNFQQVKSRSTENRLDKFCKEARFMSVVEVGQYFVTRNASEFSAYGRLSTIQLLNQKDGSEKTRELDLFWKSQRAFSTANSESKFEFNL